MTGFVLWAELALSIFFLVIINECVFYARLNHLLGLAAELFYWQQVVQRSLRRRLRR